MSVELELISNHRISDQNPSLKYNDFYKMSICKDEENSAHADGDPRSPVLHLTFILVEL